MRVSDLVRQRDRDSCQRCGIHVEIGSIHHRQGRGGFDPHRTPNLALFCGSGTTGCHHYIHNNPTESYEKGWMVRRLGIATPECTPMHTFNGVVFLLPDGSTAPAREEAHGRVHR